MGKPSVLRQLFLAHQDRSLIKTMSPRPFDQSKTIRDSIADSIAKSAKTATGMLLPDPTSTPAQSKYEYNIVDMNAYRPRSNEAMGPRFENEKGCITDPESGDLTIYRKIPSVRETYAMEDHETGENFLVRIKTATVKDIPAIISLLESIQINRENVSEKTDPNSDNSFNKRGGFIKTFTASELERLIQRQDTLTLIAHNDKTGNVEGVLVTSLDSGSYQINYQGQQINPHHPGENKYQIDIDENTFDTPEQLEDFLEAAEDDHISTGVEVAITPESKGAELIALFDATKHLLNRYYGIKDLLFQIYRLKGVQIDEDHYQEIDMKNGPSRRVHSRMLGANHIASIPGKTTSNDGIQFDIEREIFHLNTKESKERFERMKRILNLDAKRVKKRKSRDDSAF